MLNDTVYEGQWEETLKHGRGKLKTSTAVYDGPFREGLKHGAGRELDIATGRITVVNYDSGVKVRVGGKDVTETKGGSVNVGPKQY